MMIPKEYVSQNDLQKGGIHGDTEEFNDQAALAEFHPSKAKIWRVIIYHDKNLVFGLKVDYFIFEQNLIVEGEQHMGTFWGGGYEETIELAEQEFVVQVIGRCGGIMDNFGIVTSTGRKFSFGGTGGNPFTIDPPNGYHIGYLKGGFGGHIHHIEAVPVQYETGILYIAPDAKLLKQQDQLLGGFAATDQFSTPRGSYSIGKEVGRGAYGTIHLGEDSKGEIVAIKKLSKSQNHSNDFEYRICSLFDHKNIVKVIDFHETQNRTYIVFEYCSRKDLKNFVRKKSGNCLQEEKALDIFAQILEGLKEIHRQKLVHRDIKPKNILLSADGTAKICDFGLTVEQGSSISGAYDIFCWGMSLFKVITGKWPFDPPDSLQVTMMGLARENRPLNFPSNVSLGCQALIRGTLEGEIQRRTDLPTAMGQVLNLINGYKKEMEKAAKTKPKKKQEDQKQEFLPMKSEEKPTIIEEKTTNIEEESKIMINGDNKKPASKPEISDDSYPAHLGSKPKNEDNSMQLEKNGSLDKNDSSQKQEALPLVSENGSVSRNDCSQKKEDDQLVPELKSNDGKNSQMMDLEYKAGVEQSDTLRFSDELVLAKYSKYFYKVWQVAVYHDGKSIFGLKTDYFIFGLNEVVEGQRWLGTKWEGGHQSIIQLASDEFITKVTGKIDTALRSFGLKTNKERELSFGGSEGTSFELQAPSNYCFRGISGGFGDQIHYIELEPFPIGLFESKGVPVNLCPEKREKGLPSFDPLLPK